LLLCFASRYGFFNPKFDKNSPWDELNIPKRELYIKKILVITNRNQAYFVELKTRGLQEDILNFPKISPVKSLV